MLPAYGQTTSAVTSVTGNICAVIIINIILASFHSPSLYDGVVAVLCPFNGFPKQIKKKRKPSKISEEISFWVPSTQPSPPLSNVSQNELRVVSMHSAHCPIHFKYTDCTHAHFVLLLLLRTLFSTTFAAHVLTMRLCACPIVLSAAGYDGMCATERPRLSHTHTSAC